MQAGIFGMMLLSALSLAACGGSTGSGLSGPGTGGATGGSGGKGPVAQGGTNAGGVSGDGGVSGSTDKYPLDEVCQKTAPLGCDMSQGCCQKSGFGYDQEGCIQREIAECEKDVAEVKAGTMTYDGSMIDSCLPALQSFLNQCVVDYAYLFQYLDALEPCTRIWQGQRPIGADCDRDAQCAMANDPNVFVACHKTKKICYQTLRLSEGQQCQVSLDTMSFCASGLYCDAAIVGTPPYLGVCKQATAEGQNCDALDVYNLKCGTGFYCNPSTSVCTRSKAGGTPCFGALECQSYQCTLGTCAAIEPVVTQAACTG